MNRCRFGLMLLILLLAGGLTVTWHMERIHEPMVTDISRAAECAHSGDWPGAENLLAQARNAWTDHWGLNASLSDHEPMETVTALFARLEVAAQFRDPDRFSELCAEVTAALDAMGDAHSFVWWNFL